MVLSAAAPAAASSDRRPEVLILHSYHKGLSWVDDQTAGMTEIFDQQKIDVMFHVEYMDWKFSPTQENLRLRYEQYKLRYPARKIDLILTTDDVALSFALKHRRELFSDAPIVFNGVLRDSALAITAGSRNVTGIFEKYDMENTVALIRRFDPGLSTLYLLYDTTESGRQSGFLMSEALKKNNPEIALVHLHDWKISDIIRRLADAHLPPHSAVLANTYSRDSEGTTMEMHRFVKMISASSNAPVYILYDFDSGYGAVGGSLVGGRQQGSVSALLGIRILKGEDASGIPFVDKEVSRVVLDYQQMVRFGFSPNLAPEGSEFINRPVSFFEKYRTTVLAVGAVFITMLSLIVLLILSIRRRISAERALFSSRNYLHKIINTVGDPLFVKDRKYRFILVNDAFLAFSQKVRDHVVDHDDVEVFGAEDSAVYHESDDRVFADGEECVSMEKVRLGAETTRIFETKKTLYVNEQGEKFVVGIVRDMTRIREAEDMLKRMNDTLEEKVGIRTRELSDALDTLKETQDQLIQSGKLAALGSLVAGITHEINTPLGNSVMAATYLEKIEERFSSLPYEQQRDSSAIAGFISELKEDVRVLVGNLERVAELVRSFKSIAVDQVASEKRIVNVRSVLSDTLVAMTPSLKKTKLSVDLQCPPDLEWECYPGVLSQIISNFIMNSIIHAYDPGQSGQISIRAWREHSEIVFCYSDDGKGMDENVRAKVFDPFFTTNRGKGGSGLGMYIVYNLVTQKIAGLISCTSAPAQGATFLIRAPFICTE
jgi:PAS domain S-box-containing protein